MIRIPLLAIMLLLLCGGCITGVSGDWPLVVQHELIRNGDIAAAGSRPTSIVISSYNLSDCKSPADLHKDLQTNDADVWLFQELRIGSVDHLESMLVGAWHLAVLSVNTIAPGEPDREAQVIASRFPIMRTEVWTLAEDSVLRRCALVAWIDVGGGRDMLIVNTDHEPGFFESVPTQDRHRDVLLRRLNDLPSQMVVAGGDFNTCGNFWRFRSSRADAEHLQKAMNQIGFASVSGPPRVSFFPRWEMYLDQLFARGMRVLAGGVVESATGSDHRPVWCRVEVDRS